jgi:shikimate dehydrogenase
MPATAKGNSNTRFLTGLVGSGIAASRSPWLHESEASAQGVRLIYSLYDLPQASSPGDLANLIAAASTMGFSGLNVTHPFKQTVMSLLDEISDDARAIGAVNTICFVDGRTVGFNTDHLGFAESLKRGLAGQEFGKVVQLGAGGAGSATAHALLQHGARELVIHDVEAARAQALAKRLADSFESASVSVTDDPVASLEGADGLVNASPVGMIGHPGLPIPPSSIAPPLWVADVIYFPLETELLRAARGAGCTTVNGVAMVVFQAAAAFDLFTGLVSDRERMLKAALEQWSEPTGNRKP